MRCSSLPSSRKACVPKRAVFVQGRRTRLQKHPKEERRKCHAFWGNNENKDKDDKKIDPLLKKLKGAVNEIETEEELNEYLARNGEQMTVVKIATSFCGPCKLMKPKFDLFAENYSDALFLYVLSDKNEKTKQLSDKLKVSEVPSFRFFRSGEQVWQYAGANEKILRMTIIDNLQDGEKR
jgi:thioredoxin 1